MNTRDSQSQHKQEEEQEEELRNGNATLGKEEKRERGTKVNEHQEKERDLGRENK